MTLQSPAVSETAPLLPLEAQRLLAWLGTREADGDPAWLIELVGHLRPRRREEDEAAIARLDALILHVETSPALASSFSRHLLSTFPGRLERNLLAETGLEFEEGLRTGVMRRIDRALLPDVPDRSLWADVLGEVFCKRRDASWVPAAGTARWARLLRAVLPPGALELPGAQKALAHLRNELLESLRMLSHRIAALGVSPTLTRYHQPVQTESPFVSQADELLRWCDAAAAVPDQPLSQVEPARIDQAQRFLDAAAKVLVEVRGKANLHGTSIELTRLLLQARQAIDRVKVLLAVASAPGLDAALPPLARLLEELVEGHCLQKSVRDLLTRSTDLLALQVTENAGRTGEHYVTSTRAEYGAMARSAMGAGLIVGVMALVKILITALHLPAFWEAFVVGLNYATGFVLVHLFHFTIATKQPAMTAAKIASVIGEESDRATALDRLAGLTAQISRTQLIAIFGNVALAIPAALGVAWTWILARGEPVTDVAKATHLLADLHAWKSAAIPHAAIAGICLFLAGVISGVWDNRCVFERIPERLERLGWLRWLLGPARLGRLARYVEGNLGAIAGNVAFGFMLGFVGFFGRILGLPLDIRHVTFAAANAAYGLVGLDFAIPLEDLAAIVLGVVLIGATNLAVSFGLAFYTALKARRLRLHGGWDFLRALWHRFRAAPRAFFLPPKE